MYILEENEIPLYYLGYKMNLMHSIDTLYIIKKAYSRISTCSANSAVCITNSIKVSFNLLSFWLPLHCKLLAMKNLN